MPLRTLTLDALTVTDERSFRHVGIYDSLKSVLLRDGARFYVASPDSRFADWNRALFLNLTFWNASEPGDVLTRDEIPADVVAHVAWHHLARQHLAVDARMSADAMLLGESIASAFDLYLVGRLLAHAPDSDFLATQVPAMHDAAESAGMDDAAFEALLTGIASEPERAFEALRELLFDAATSLVRCTTIDAAARVFERLDGHRYGGLLHHYELSNWVLFARAGGIGSERDARVSALDGALRSAPVALEWLEREWVAAAR